VFGLIAAVGTTILGFSVAAVSSWYGGWVDATIQRLTEINMMIPFLPTIMIVGSFFSRSLWVVLAFIIGFGVLTGRIKSYRAMLLQMVHAECIEAARAYGASDRRIVFRYLIPRALPVLLPHVILAVPIFVFLETSLVFLGINDPNRIPWGSMLGDIRAALYNGCYYEVLQPVIVMFFTALFLSVMGYTLERAFILRLRDR